MKAFALKELIPTEADEAECLMQWAAVTRHNGFRLSDYLVMIPNKVKLTGDSRERAITMNAWKRSGFKAGASDYFLAIPTAHYPGLWIELKRTRLGIISEEQASFQAKMIAIGYRAVISRGWEAARDAITEYLSG